MCVCTYTLTVPVSVPEAGVSDWSHKRIYEKRSVCFLPGFLSEISLHKIRRNRAENIATSRDHLTHSSVQISSLLPPTCQISCVDTKRFCILNNGIKL